MRIVIINWRSIKDPLEGGAERATFEFAKRWVKNKGAEVMWISPKYLSGPDQETIDGVKFIYLGKPLTRNIFKLLVNFPSFYISIIHYYIHNLKGKIDIVIDQVHGIPYLTPLYIKEKKIIYIHEVAGSIWDLMYPIPINWIGKIFERIFFLPYKIRKIKFIANSPSTKKDLISKLKIDKNNIKVVPYGVSAPRINEISEKYSSLTVVFLNRIVKMKGIERGLVAFKEVRKLDSKAKFLVIGRGEDTYLKYLNSLCDELGIRDGVEFLGFIDGDEKFNILAKSHVLMNPSHLEGWGLVNIEANRMGTPTVAFKVRGCIDSVIDGTTGYLCEDGDTTDLAKKIVKASNDIELRTTAQNYSQQFDWDLQSEQFYTELQDTINK